MLGGHPKDLAKLSRSNNNIAEYYHQITAWQKLYNIDLMNYHIVEAVSIISDISFIRNMGVFNLNSRNTHDVAKNYLTSMASAYLTMIFF